MNARTATTCVQCKAAEAVAFGFFADLGNAASGLPWCQSCMTEVVPVLLWWGYPVNLVSADRPAGLEICHYGECPRLCRAGRRACDDHLTELREVYAGKESGASVDPAGGDGIEARYVRGQGDDVATCLDCGGDVPMRRNIPSCSNSACPGKVDQGEAELFELPAASESTRGGYDR